MEFPFLQDIFVILALAVVVAIICHRVRIPTVVGLLVTGVIAGPHGLGLIRDVHGVELLAEVGVIFLLFAIGIEFSLSSLRRIRRLFLVGGTLQVGITIIGGYALSRILGMGGPQALFMGCVIALSSTAIVLRLLQDRKEISSPHGRMVLGVLIFQDIIVVPMILAAPILAGSYEGSLFAEVGMLAVKGVAIGVFVWVSATWIVPWFLEKIARTGSNELFLLAVGMICLAVAWLTSLMGLSLALGAFLAGLIISESEFSHRALGGVVPFRDMFTSFFFVSVGMLLDTSYVITVIPFLLVVVVAVIVLKAVAATVSGLILGLPLRVALLGGIALAQMGEFSLILAGTGVASGIMDDGNFQRFLAVAIFSMMLAPFLLSASHRIAAAAVRVPVPMRVRQGRYFVPSGDDDTLSDHLIVVGYGVIGSTLAQSAKLVDLDYVVVEINHRLVSEHRNRGVRIFYGDATQAAALEKAGIDRAKVIAVSIPDANGTRSAVELARRLNPDIHIIARTRYVQEMAPLYRLGANEVVPEELEAAIEIFSAVLFRCGVPTDTIEAYGGRTRMQYYGVFIDKEENE